LEENKNQEELKLKVQQGKSVLIKMFLSMHKELIGAKEWGIGKSL
jgi:hypothetical protein